MLKFLLTRELGDRVPKDAVLESLWPGDDPALSWQRLRFSVSVLRRTLEPELAPRSPSAYLSTGDGCYALGLGAGGFFDVDEFLRAVDLTRALDRPNTKRDAVAAYEKAIALYRGDFLEDELYAEWALPRRERLREVHTAALLRLGVLRLEEGNLVGATDLAVTAVAKEPISEPCYRLALSCYARRGEWGRVTSLYQRYRRELAEHDLPPPPALKQLLF